MIGHRLFVDLKGSLGLTEPDELAGYHPALVQQLIEAVLAVGTRLTEIDHSRVIAQRLSLQVDPLAVALHVELLNMGNEFAERLAVWQNGSCVEANYSRIVEADQAKQHGQILGDIIVFHQHLVNLVTSIEELFHYVVSVLNAQRQEPDSAPNAEPATDPVPELKHPVVWDSEVSRFFEVGRGGAEVMRNNGLFFFFSHLLLFLQNSLVTLIKPFSHTFRVENGLRGCECFGVHDNQGFFTIQSVGGTEQVKGVDVSQEPQLSVFCALSTFFGLLDGFVDKLDAEVGASYADHDNVLQRLIRIALEFP